MRDAIGGALTIQIIVIFLVIINGYLAFNVNYTKAFRVKNEIISLIEKNEGLMYEEYEGSTLTGYGAVYQIKQFLNQVGYNGESLANASNCTDGYRPMSGGYCLKRTTVDENNLINPNETYRGSYYSVITFVKIDIPVLDLLFENGMAFKVRGETRLIYSSGQY